jgi:hypothetical protein
VFNLHQKATNDSDIHAPQPFELLLQILEDWEKD